jgi:hypothetical protein
MMVQRAVLPSEMSADERRLGIEPRGAVAHGLAGAAPALELLEVREVARVDAREGLRADGVEVAGEGLVVEVGKRVAHFDARSYARAPRRASDSRARAGISLRDDRLVERAAVGPRDGALDEAGLRGGRGPEDGERALVAEHCALAAVLGPAADDHADRGRGDAAHAGRELHGGAGRGGGDVLAEVARDEGDVLGEIEPEVSEGSA